MKHGKGDELSAIIEVYLNIFNDLFSALLRRGLEYATERTLPYVEQVFREFPRVFSGFRLELRELNHYVLLENSRRVDEKEMFLGLQMLIRIMYNECRELVKDVRVFVSDKTRSSVMRNYETLREHGLLEAIPPEFRGFEKESKEVLLPYGRGYTAIRVPRDAEVLTLEKHKALRDFDAGLEEALANPIGCERLEKMVEKGEKVAVIIDDYTRKTPTRKILPVVLEKLEKRTRDITIVVASGLHRSLTQEEIEEKIGDAGARYPVVLHDANSPDLVIVGKMFTGTELRINPAVAEADFVLSVGSIMPHPYAGFSGGAKSILPGVAGREAIVSSHLLNVYPGCAVNRLEDNPMRQEIENAGRLVNLRFIVNTVLGPQGEVLGVVCGDPGEAFLRGAALCERLYSIEYSEKADIVIVTPGGYPMDSTLYLSLRGLRTAELMLKEKGTIILVAKCEEQRGEKIKEKSFRELLKGDPRDLISFSLLQKYNLVLVSEVGGEGGTIEGVEVYRDANAALQRVISRLGLDAKIIVVPDIYMIPKMRISEKVQLERKLKEYSEQLEQKVEERTRGLEKKVREFKGLYEISDLFREEVELDKIWGVVTEKIAQLMDVEQCCIILYDQENMEFTALSQAYGMKKEQLKALNFSLEYVSHAFEHWPGTEPLVSNDPAKDDRLIGELTRKLGERNLLLAKLLVAGEFLGVLRLANKRSGDFTGEDARLAGILASRLGAALHTMKLFRELRESEAELRKYAHDLERSNELKDLFTDIMRHEVLNPLSVIKGVAQFMSRMEEFKGRKEIEVIRRNVEKIEGIIDSSVMFSKISAVERLDFQEMDLDKILREVIKEMQPMAEEKNMKIKYKPLKGSIARVNPMIKDVFMNLLSNAIKYSPPKTQITLGLKDLGDKWRVMVKDQGVGIPDEYKETVFERFIRADKRGVKGTGLGLAIVKRIVELHKGEVWVEDNVKQGSVFYVTLPKNPG